MWKARVGGGEMTSNTHMRQRPWAAQEGGLVFPLSRPQDSTAKQLAALLLQLDDEGLVEAAEAGWMLPWSSIYALQRLPSYRDALALLDLPPTGDVIPVLESRGSLTDR